EHRSERSVGQSLRIARARELLIGDQALGKESLANPVLKPRRWTRAGARLNCHAVMLAGSAIVGNGDLPNPMGSLSRLGHALIPPRLLGTSGSFFYWGVV